MTFMYPRPLVAYSQRLCLASRSRCLLKSLIYRRPSEQDFGQLEFLDEREFTTEDQDFDSNLGR